MIGKKQFTKDNIKSKLNNISSGKFLKNARNYRTTRRERLIIVFAFIVSLAFVFVSSNRQEVNEAVDPIIPQEIKERVQDTTPTTPDEPQQQQQQRNNRYYEPTPRLQISKSSDDQYYYYSNKYIIPLTSYDAPVIDISPSNIKGDLIIKMYEVGVDSILNALIYNEDDRSVGTVDVDSLNKFDEFTVEHENKNINVSLPLAKTGLYYVLVESRDRDPVYPEEPLISQGAFIHRSDFGVRANEGNNETVFWGYNLQERESIDEGDVTIYYLKNKPQVVGTGKFDETGIANAPLTARNDIAVVDHEGDIAIVPLNYTYTNYHYSTEFTDKRIYDRLFVFTDRPLYRPGDEVFYKVIVRKDDDARYSIPNENYTIGLGSGYGYGYGDDSTIETQVKSASSDGTISGSFTIPEDSGTGYFNVFVENVSTEQNFQWNYGGTASRTSYQFQVEHFRKPEYSVDVNVPDRRFISGDNFEFDISGNYFSGHPLTGQSVEYAIYLGEYYDTDYYDYAKERASNDDYRYGYWNRLSTFKEGRITFDENGNAKFSEPLKIPHSDKGLTVVTLEAIFDDGSGNPSFDRKNVLFYTAEFGIYRDGYGGSGKVNEEYELPIKLLGYSSENKISNIKLDAKGDWSRRNVIYDENGKYLKSEKEEGEISIDSVTTNSEGEAVIKFTPREIASYNIIVTGTDSRGNKLEKDFWFYSRDKDSASYRYYGDDQNVYYPLSFDLDKTEYKPGDTAVLTILSDIPNRDVWLTLERGRTSRHQVVEVNNGKTSVEVPIIDSDLPDIYARVSSFSEMTHQTYVEEVPVTTDGKKLNIQIIPNGSGKFGPGDNVTLDIITTNNNNIPVSAEVAVWAVDKAIFELVGQDDYDIFNTFWSKRYNTTGSSHSLVSIGGFGAERGGCFLSGTQILMSDGSTRSIEDVKIGDYVLTKSNENDNKLVKAKVLGTHETIDSGYFIINEKLKVTSDHILYLNGEWQVAGNIQIGDVLLDKYNLPQQVYSVEWLSAKEKVYNLEIEDHHTYFADGYYVHNDKGGGDAREVFKDTAYWNPSVKTNSDGKATVTFKAPDNLTTWVVAGVGATRDTIVGSTTSELIVSKDIIIRPILPNVLREGDDIIVSALVQNFTDNSQNIDLNVEFDSGQIVNDSERNINLDSNSISTQSWIFNPNSPKEDAKIRFEAISTTSDEGDILVHTLPVRRYGYYDDRGDTAIGNTKFSVNLSEDALNDYTDISISLSPNILGSTISAFNYLVDYPYGCMEQTTSRFVPTVIAASNPKIFKDAIADKDVEDMINTGIERIYGKRNVDGGWNWGYGGDSDVFLTAYVVEYLYEVDKLGYELPEDLLPDAITFLESKRDLPTDYPENLKQIIPAAYALSIIEKDRSFQLQNIDTVAIADDLLALAVITNYRAGNTNPETNGLNELVERVNLEYNYAYWSKGHEYRYGSNYASTAFALRALIEAGYSDDMINKVVTYISLPKQNYYWGNTYGTAQIMRALSEYTESINAVNTKYAYKVTLDGRTIASGSVFDMDSVINEISINHNDILPNGSKIEITKDGDGEIYSSLFVKEFRTSRDTQSLDRGLEVIRTYISEKGEGHPLVVGDLVDVKISVDSESSNGVSLYGLVEDTLPAGLIPVNTKLDNEQAISGNNRRYSWYRYNGGGIEFTEDGAQFYMNRFNPERSVYSYKARVINAGTFDIPPATASYMYAPEVNGRSESQSITIATSLDDLKNDPERFAIPGVSKFKEKADKYYKYEEPVPERPVVSDETSEKDSEMKPDGQKQTIILLVGLFITLAGYLLYRMNKRKTASKEQKSEDKKSQDKNEK